MLTIKKMTLINDVKIQAEILPPPGGVAPSDPMETTATLIDEPTPGITPL